jgi:UV DNA damage repair endonuclease
MTIKKIGFACKLSELDPKKGIISIPEYNTGTTTVAWLNRQSKDVAEQRLWDLMVQNIESVRKLVEKVGTLDEHLRMVRIGSDVLPVFTHSDWGYFWCRTDVKHYCEHNFRAVGDLARLHGVRLSFHPGQFTCIVSDSPGIVERSIEELEYHTNMIRWMDFGKSKLDFKLNIHLSGRRGVDGFNDAWIKMSPELRNCLTLENDEYQKGLDDLLILKDKVGIVLDIHHHLIKEDEYIQSNDPRIRQVIESWQGVRPTFHYSQSRDEYINKFLDQIPSMAEMLTTAKKSKLRAHSDFYTNKKINEWALTHLSWGDCMAESKSKNLASAELFNQWRESNGIVSSLAHRYNLDDAVLRI